MCADVHLRYKELMTSEENQFPQHNIKTVFRPLWELSRLVVVLPPTITWLSAAGLLLSPLWLRGCFCVFYNVHIFIMLAINLTRKFTGDYHFTAAFSGDKIPTIRSFVWWDGMGSVNRPSYLARRYSSKGLQWVVGAQVVVSAQQKIDTTMCWWRWAESSN